MDRRLGSVDEKLGREISGSTDNRTDRGRVGDISQILGHAEVDQLDDLDPVLLHQETVGWLDVAVKDVARVCGGERVAELEGEPRHARPRQGPFALENLRKIETMQVLHDHVVLAAFRPAVVEDPRDVAIPPHELEQSLRLTQKPARYAWRRRETSVQELHGDDGARDVPVFASVHRCHAALAQASDQPVIAGESPQA
ncbi:hypothetical protein OV079_49265 [Nannocystis pusilla]|uniref:Uncharacterized protein n=1 Tax=Nannocystis pusilla TaxID=889268 RepID=A0A9X3J3M2_9BACT|nr:hypothetical protein [Nannocystis pusilla]MCY1013390.1 hypothetical protein [Nannocystis pusilla]